MNKIAKDTKFVKELYFKTKEGKLVWEDSVGACGLVCALLSDVRCVLRRTEGTFELTIERLFDRGSSTYLFSTTREVRDLWDLASVSLTGPPRWAEDALFVRQES